MKPKPKYIDLTKPEEPKPHYDYIVCEKWANQGRVWVGICEKRCKDSAVCEAYQEYLKEKE